MDMALVAHLSTLKASVPFLHFFDGFRTSHEIQKIDAIDYEDIGQAGCLGQGRRAFRARALNPEHPHQARHRAEPGYLLPGPRGRQQVLLTPLPAIVEEVMDEGRQDHRPRTTSCSTTSARPMPSSVIVAMGSGCDAVDETINYLNAKGEKVGLVKVHLYRPFSAKHFLDAIPATCKKIAVLDRTKEPGSLGEPLYQDVCTALRRGRPQ